MPIYEYQCSQCGKIFEKLIMSGGSAASVHCDGCGSSEVHRMMSRFSASSGQGGSGGEGASCAPSPSRFT
ncbi:MAG: zinc ribbon domain-containing protein [Deltaproteobacteria bacterium]|nr:zinc ribbon domain-containing protein [Deltaproteobacteria bacterium]MBW2306390.1 zinc ribbon domain-containing protein [Deltaproteobacteria bacterium]